MAALACGLIQDDGAGGGDVEGGDAAGHGDAEEMVAGAAREVVEAFAFAAEDDDGVGGPVVFVVSHGAALVEADAPDILLLELLEGADEVDDAGDAEVFGGSGGGFDGDGAEGRGAALGEDDAVDAGSVRGAEERAEVLGIFDAVEGEEETGGGRGVLRRSEEVFESEEFAFADDGDDALVAGRFGDAGELVAILKANANALCATEFYEALELLRVAALLALTADADMIETAVAGAQGFFYRVQPE